MCVIDARGEGGPGVIVTPRGGGAISHGPPFVSPPRPMLLITCVCEPTVQLFAEVPPRQRA